MEQFIIPCVGAFFAEMKTTTVRKLIADNWGFLCPVHTPDGAPCGLLNHLSSTCKVCIGRSVTRSLNFLLVFLILHSLAHPLHLHFTGSHLRADSGADAEY